MIKLFQDELPINVNLPFFAQKKYLSSKSKNYGWFISDDFILPFIIYKKNIFKRLVFTTGVIERKTSNIKEEKKFLNEVVKYVKIHKICDFIHKPQPSAIFRTYPDNCDAFRWGTYKINIEENFDNMLPGEENRTFERTQYEILELLRKTMRPEFLNRIDEIVVFKPLNRNEIKAIVRMQLNKVNEMLTKNGYTFVYTEEAVEHIADEGYDPLMGARPIKRVIQKYVINELSKMIIAEKIKNDTPIVLDVIDNDYVFYNKTINNN